MPVPTIANEHKMNSDRLRTAAVQGVSRIWKRFNPKRMTESYGVILPDLMERVERAQFIAADVADDYLTDISGYEPAFELNPLAFSGIAADGRDLETLLEQPLSAALDAYYDDDLGGTTAIREARARKAGLFSVQRIAATETADAGRTADQVALVSRPQLTGYVRVLELPSCDRCVILAGRRYRWSDGFDRHPACDCRHVPVSEADDVDSMTTDPAEAIRSGQVHGLSEADTQAVLDGADPAQVINAKRGGMSTAAGYKTTREGTSRRGLAGQRRGRGKPRLRPESIYELAADRAEAIEMLRAHGYTI